MKNKICAECACWKPGDCWFGSDGKHGVTVEAPGFCMFKKDKNGNVVKRKRWNYHPACENIIKKKKTGFIYQGGGGNTIQEDLENVTGLMKELAEDNKEE